VLCSEQAEASVRLAWTCAAALRLHIGQVSLGFQQVALCVGQVLLLTGGDPLAATLAVWPANFPGADGLTADDGLWGLVSAAYRRTVPLTMPGIDLLRSAEASPATLVAGNRQPRQELMR